MPLVTMYNIRLPIQLRQHFHHCTAEQNKTLIIVRVAVNTLAIKIAVIINQVNRYFFIEIT